MKYIILCLAIFHTCTCNVHAQNNVTWIHSDIAQNLHVGPNLGFSHLKFNGKYWKGYTVSLGYQIRLNNEMGASYSGIGSYYKSSPNMNLFWENEGFVGKFEYKWQDKTWNDELIFYTGIGSSFKYLWANHAYQYLLDHYHSYVGVKDVFNQKTYIFEPFIEKGLVSNHGKRVLLDFSLGITCAFKYKMREMVSQQIPAYEMNFHPFSVYPGFLMQFRVGWSFTSLKENFFVRTPKPKQTGSRWSRKKWKARR